MFKEQNSRLLGRVYGSLARFSVDNNSERTYLCAMGWQVWALALFLGTIWRGIPFAYHIRMMYHIAKVGAGPNLTTIRTSA